MNHFKKNMEYKSFREFWPFYVSQHRNPINRKLHLIGTLVGLLTGLIIIYSGQPLLGFFLGLFIGYGFAWTGHFVFEKNRPATFQFPIYSLLGDFRLLFYTLTKKDFL